MHVWEGHNFRGQHQEDPLAVHCFCVCSGSALLGNLLGVSISTPGKATFRLSCRFILGFSCAYSLCIVDVSSCSKDSLSVVVFYYMLMCVGCFGLL